MLSHNCEEMDDKSKMNIQKLTDEELEEIIETL